MKERIKINDQWVVGGQPTEEQLEQLAQEGFKTVVNFRTAGEVEQPLSPKEEGEKVRKLGIEYLHIPVSTENMSPEQVDQFRQQIPQLPTPLFAHCGTGKRAGAFVMMHTAIEARMSGEEGLQKAEQMGFECDTPHLMEFVKDYIDRNRK